jgi:primosomal protein DnaI
MIRQHNKKVAFVNVSELLSDLKSQFNVANSNIDEVIEELQKVDILVLDDLGGETFSAWSINDVLYKIIDYRNRSGLLTCYSSSYSLEDLQKEYLKRSSKATRLISKIQAYADEVELKGASAL